MIILRIYGTDWNCGIPIICVITDYNTLYDHDKKQHQPIRLLNFFYLLTCTLSETLRGISFSTDSRVGWTMLHFPEAASYLRFIHFANFLLIYDSLTVYILLRTTTRLT